MRETLLRHKAAQTAAGSPARVEGVFFIVGSPRSGTTLLRTMLASHSSVCVPHETEFFMRVPRVRGASLRRAVEGYVRSGPFANQELDGASLVTGVVRGAFRTRAEVFVEMLARHARRSGRTVVGEKSPHHCRHVEAIAEELPGARFIHILRDARDVIASRLGMEWSGRSVAWGARSWAGIAREHRRLERVMPVERYTSVRFEDLLHAPAAELRRLSGFLGLEFEPAMLNFDKRAREGARAGDPAWAGVTVRAIEADAIGRYQGRLDARGIASIQRFAGAEMVRAGYALEPRRARPDWVVRDALELVGERASSLGRSVRRRLGLRHDAPAAHAWNGAHIREQPAH